MAYGLPVVLQMLTSFHIVCGFVETE